MYAFIFSISTFKKRGLNSEDERKLMVSWGIAAHMFLTKAEVGAGRVPPDGLCLLKIVGRAVPAEDVVEPQRRLVMQILFAQRPRLPRLTTLDPIFKQRPALFW